MSQSEPSPFSKTRSMSEVRSTDSTSPYVNQSMPSGELIHQFEEIVSQDVMTWSASYELIRKLGSGGQSVVFLADRLGAFKARFRLAVKVFTPVCYPDAENYYLEMARIAEVSAIIAKIQQDHLVDVQNVVTSNGIQSLIMEWVDGYDLDQLMAPRVLENLRYNIDKEQWNYINDVIVTNTTRRLRFKPGIAINVLRECLTGLAALHREGIVHADLKPSNIMIKRTGNSKIIDFGSAFQISNVPKRQTWTPRYAAVELLEGGQHSISSDLASLGYVLVEMLSGTPVFLGINNMEELIKAKRKLPEKIKHHLPKDVAENDILVNLIQGLIHPDPNERFENAESADYLDKGASDFQRQLVKGNLSTNYENDIRLWLAEIDHI